MNTFRITLGILAVLVSGGVCWQCFAWFRRFRRRAFLWCGLIAAVAWLYSCLILFVAACHLDAAGMDRQIAAWQPSELPLQQLQQRVEASWNSMIISGALGAGILALLPGFYGLVCLGRAASTVPGAERGAGKK